MKKKKKNKYLDAYLRGLTLVDICKLFEVEMRDLPQLFEKGDPEPEEADSKKRKNMNLDDIPETLKQVVCESYIAGLFIGTIAKKYHLSSYMVHEIIMEAGLEHIMDKDYVPDYKVIKKHREKFRNANKHLFNNRKP